MTKAIKFIYAITLLIPFIGFSQDVIKKNGLTSPNDTLKSITRLITSSKKFGISVEIGKPEPFGVKKSTSFRSMMLNSIIGLGASLNYRYISKEKPFHINYKLGYHLQIYNGDARQLILSSIYGNGMNKNDYENGKTQISYFQLSAIPNYNIQLKNFELQIGIGPSFAYLNNENKLSENLGVFTSQTKNSLYFSPLFSIGIEKNNLLFNAQYQSYNSSILGSVDMLSLVTVYYLK